MQCSFIAKNTNSCINKDFLFLFILVVYGLCDAKMYEQGSSLSFYLDFKVLFDYETMRPLYQQGLNFCL